MPGHIILPTKVVDCIIMAGQSNCTGGDNTGSPNATYTNPQPNTLIFWKNNDASSINNGLWETYLWGYNSDWENTRLAYNGADISMGYNYFNNTGKPLWIIKYGYPGAALVDDGTPFQYGLFQWDANPANCNGLPHYSNMVNNFCIPAILKARAQGIQLNIKGIHWMQGEADCTYASRYPYYQSTLIAMIDKLISDLTPYGVIYSGFKPIITRIANHNPNYTYGTQVRTAQVNVAAHYNATWIDTDSYPVIADNSHYTRDGQITMGSDVCNVYQTL